MESQQVIPMPERSIGRAGCDLPLSDKDLTVVLVPYERYSVFPKAVDDLYRNLDIPFNVIVIEGNAPEDIRVALEKRQRRRGNMTILYTNYCPVLANAFNLAMPHVKTPYALLMDNEIRLPQGTVEGMLAAAREKEAAVVTPKEGLIPRHVRIRTAEGEERWQAIKTLGVRPCLLISRTAMKGRRKLFDELSSAYSLGVDFLYRARSRGLAVYEHPEAVVTTRPDGALRSSDLPLFRTQWNPERISRSVEALQNSWGVRLEGDRGYDAWLRAKMESVEGPATVEEVVLHALYRWREIGWRHVREMAIPIRPLSLAGSSCATKSEISQSA